MPLRVSIGRPRDPARFASTQRTREAAIEGMRSWEDAIRIHAPWFRLELVEDEPEAAVQVVWKRRISGAAGWGGIHWHVDGGQLVVGGRMEVSTTPDPFTLLDVDEIRLLVAHEFGHVLGLGHCLDCDSAMNYAWHTRERILVTEVDVRTFLALVAMPNGSRLDGKLLHGLDAGGAEGEQR
jgi:hypothetical protein